MRTTTAKHGGPVDISHSLSPLHVLRFYQVRVWWEDIEADVCEGNNVYQRVLLEWARISRGCFSPTNIEERWDSDERPITVTFRTRGQTVTLNPECVDDWLDLAVLVPINALVER